MKALLYGAAGLAHAVLPLAPPVAGAHSPSPAAALEVPPDREPPFRLEPGPPPRSAPAGRGLRGEGSRTP